MCMLSILLLLGVLHKTIGLQLLMDQLNKVPWRTVYTKRNVYFVMQQLNMVYNISLQVTAFQLGY